MALSNHRSITARKEFVLSFFDDLTWASGPTEMGNKTDLIQEFRKDIDILTFSNDGRALGYGFAPRYLRKLAFITS